MKEILTEQEYQQALEANLDGMIILFSSENCGPCKFIIPILEEIEKEKKITICKIILNDKMSITIIRIIRRLNMVHVPTLVFFENRKESGDYLVGMQTKSMVECWLKLRRG